jgi:hypothetical protein
MSSTVVVAAQQTGTNGMINTYELDYSPPNSNTSTLKQKYLSNIVNNNYLANAETSAPAVVGINVNNLANSFTNLGINTSTQNNTYSNVSSGSNGNIATFSNNAFSTSGLSSAQHAAGLENKCLRCSNQVGFFTHSDDCF